MSKRVFFVFAVVQGLGVLGAVLWSSTYSAAGPWLWMMGFFLMFPGNFSSASLVDATLWGTGLSLRDLSIVTLALAVAINAAIWSLTRWGIRSVSRMRLRVKPR